MVLKEYIMHVYMNVNIWKREYMCVFTQTFPNIQDATQEYIFWVHYKSVDAV